MGRLRKLGCLLALTAMLAALTAPGAGAGGLSSTQIPANGGIAAPGSPYRFQTVTVGSRHHLTVVEQVRRRGGLIGRRWLLPGAWHLSAPAYDREGAGLAADAPVLVVSRYGVPRKGGMRRHTELAFLHTGPYRPHGPAPIRRVTLPGDLTVQAISPDGSTLYLSHNLAGGPASPRFTIVPYSVRSGRLLSPKAIHDNGEILSGTAAARTEDPGGRRVFTLYVDHRDHGQRTYLMGLDTVDNRLAAFALPRLSGLKNPFLLDLELGPSGSTVVIRKHSARDSVHREPVIARVDVTRLTAPRERRPRPARAHLFGSFMHVIGESREGRPIELREVGDVALPMRLMVFACIHGDECGASAVEPLRNGCPDPGAHVDVVTNLDPDGSARRSRLNAAGVDLNRNFATAWRPLGSPGDPEYSGPHPFSEPEARLAARLIRHRHPRVTIWFHQHWGSGSFVRAWGQSAPAARRFAALAGLRFRLMRWPAGTAPHWQNHAFPGTASFVVELPRGKLPGRQLIRLDLALGRFGEEVEEDPQVARKG
jgi:protein MpaA